MNKKQQGGGVQVFTPNTVRPEVGQINLQPVQPTLPLDNRAYLETLNSRLKIEQTEALKSQRKQLVKQQSLAALQGLQDKTTGLDFFSERDKRKFSEIKSEIGIPEDLGASIDPNNQFLIKDFERKLSKLQNHPEVRQMVQKQAFIKEAGSKFTNKSIDKNPMQVAAFNELIAKERGYNGDFYRSGEDVLAGVLRGLPSEVDFVGELDSYLKVVNKESFTDSPEERQKMMSAVSARATLNPEIRDAGLSEGYLVADDTSASGYSTTKKFDNTFGVLIDNKFKQKAEEDAPSFLDEFFKGISTTDNIRALTYGDAYRFITKNSREPNADELTLMLEKRIKEAQDAGVDIDARKKSNKTPSGDSTLTINDFIKKNISIPETLKPLTDEGEFVTEDLRSEVGVFVQRLRDSGVDMGENGVLSEVQEIINKGAANRDQPEVSENFAQYLTDEFNALGVAPAIDIVERFQESSTPVSPSTQTPIEQTSVGQDINPQDLNQRLDVENFVTVEVGNEVVTISGYEGQPGDELYTVSLKNPDTGEDVIFKFTYDTLVKEGILKNAR